MDARVRFERLADQLTGSHDVETPGKGRGFGSTALKTGGCIFAMLSHDMLVVKLSAERVDELIESGEGAGFDAGKGRPMRNWVTVLDGDSWSPLALEALRFVSATGSR